MIKNLTVLFQLALVTSLGLTTGCKQTETNKSPSHAVSAIAAEQLVQAGKIDEAAEMYSRVGEILLSRPEGIVHANEMFKKSLALNSSHSKSNVYSAMMAPLLSVKGFLPRFKNVIGTDKSDLNRVTSLEKQIREKEVQEFIDFALVMPADTMPAARIDDVRKFVRNEYVKELKNSIRKLDNIQAENFVMNLNISTYKEPAKEQYSSCPYTGDNEITCQSVPARKNSNIKYSVDKHDIKALKIILKTKKNALTLANSIGLVGFEAIAGKLNNKRSTDQEVISAIRSQKNLLKIEGSRDELNEIFTHTEEVLNDLIDFARISKEVCHSKDRENNIANNICVTEAAAEKINELLMFVVGPKSVVLGQDQDGEEVSVEIDLRALLNSRVSSLQELLPTKFDSRGKAIEVKDLTFAGIIPNADLITKLKAVAK